MEKQIIQRSETNLKKIKTHPADYILEAELLLAYVAQNGLEIDDALVSVLVNSRHWWEQDEWTPEREIQFWMAFNTIAKRVAPVSVASLKATNPAAESSIVGESKKLNFYASLPKGSTFAKQTVSLYQRGAILVLLVLLLTHSYWLLESMWISPLLELPQKIEKTTEQLNREMERVEPQKQAESQKINSLQAKIEDYQNRLLTHYQMIKSCKPWVGLFATCSVLEQSGAAQEGSKLDESEIDETLLQKKFILATLQLFVLPLLYGLLGASVYVLRTLTIEIRTLTYTVESNISYRLRIQLGALAGLAIGWFTGPNAFLSLEPISSETLSQFSSFGTLSPQTLSPMALAFVAGYSVDVLFALMDRVIYAFSASDSSSINTLGKPIVTTNNKSRGK